MPGAAGSWWALLTARTGAHYVEANHMGAQAARLSILRSACAAASLSLGARGAQEHRVPGRARFKARRGSAVRPGLGAASSASPVKPGPDWGRRKREGGSLHQRKRQRGAPPPPGSPPGVAGQLSLGAPADLGETPLPALLGAGCTGFCPL